MENVNAMIKFAYFTANFPHDFIEKCWADENWLVEHLKTKMETYTFLDGKGYVTFNVFMNFFLNLDNGNQVKLCKWINENYKK
jgi:hypothetical protein